MIILLLMTIIMIMIVSESVSDSYRNSNSNDNNTDVSGNNQVELMQNSNVLSIMGQWICLTLPSCTYISHLAAVDMGVFIICNLLKLIFYRGFQNDLPFIESFGMADHLLSLSYCSTSLFLTNIIEYNEMLHWCMFFPHATLNYCCWVTHATSKYFSKH